tara:strand:+ start:372 stop:629 length:258 start_codon:yes stop_codon:yes gene_type:complete
MMNPFEMVVAIIAIVTIGKIIQTRMQARDHEAPVHAAEDAEARQMRDEIRNLRERIAVLERVITDSHSSTSLDREIDRLRDKNKS